MRLSNRIARTRNTHMLCRYMRDVQTVCDLERELNMRARIRNLRYIQLMLFYELCLWRQESSNGEDLFISHFGRL